MNLLIHADPGARSGLLGAWLLDELRLVTFDVGKELGTRFRKIHRLHDAKIIQTHPGVKLRVRPKLDHIDLHCLLFLKKNVHAQFPNFSRDEYDLATFAKLYKFAEEVFRWNSELDYNLYDYIIDFDQTFDCDHMIHLYYSMNQQMPSRQSIDILLRTNDQNRIKLDLNHAASIVKTVLIKEKQLRVQETQRRWSIVEVYTQTPRCRLYDTVVTYLHPDHYHD